MQIAVFQRIRNHIIKVNRQVTSTARDLKINYQLGNVTKQLKEVSECVLWIIDDR